MDDLPTRAAPKKTSLFERIAVSEKSGDMILVVAASSDKYRQLMSLIELLDLLFSYNHRESD